MSLDLDDRLRRYGDTFEQAVVASETGRRPSPNVAMARPRRWGRWLVAATLLFGVVALAVVGVPSRSR